MEPIIRAGKVLAALVQNPDGTGKAAKFVVPLVPIVVKAACKGVILAGEVAKISIGEIAKISK